jgi:hypothetical protein
MSFSITRTRCVWCAVVLACSTPIHEPLNAQESASQRAVIDALLRRSPIWRRAISADNTKIPEMRRAGVPIPEHPYFASSGTEGSFAVALVKADTFKVFYSRRESGKYSQPREVTSAVWLNRGQLAVRADTLEIVPLASDEIFTYVWSARRHAMVLQPKK